MQGCLYGDNTNLLDISKNVQEYVNRKSKSSPFRTTPENKQVSHKTTLSDWRNLYNKHKRQFRPPQPQRNLKNASLLDFKPVMTITSDIKPAATDRQCCKAYRHKKWQSAHKKRDQSKQKEYWKENSQKKMVNRNHMSSLARTTRTTKHSDKQHLINTSLLQGMHNRELMGWDKINLQNLSSKLSNFYQTQFKHHPQDYQTIFTNIPKNYSPESSKARRQQAMMMYKRNKLAGLRTAKSILPLGQCQAKEYNFACAHSSEKINFSKFIVPTGS